MSNLKGEDLKIGDRVSWTRNGHHEKTEGVVTHHPEYNKLMIITDDSRVFFIGVSPNSYNYTLISRQYKRFMVFAYYQYYPNGGMQDVVGSFDTKEETILALPDIKKRLSEYNTGDLEGLEVFDRIDGVVVYSE